MICRIGIIFRRRAADGRSNGLHRLCGHSVFINFCIDFICLYLSAKLCACPAGIARTALGSALGGLYAVAALRSTRCPPRPSCRCICWRRSSSALRPSSAATGKDAALLRAVHRRQR
ncbi:MAG: sigma-E processing peptidase SpoIIGA [Acutalibacteraceae bacterium]